ncbi:unnamed protein product [Albugo candida]|uniref:Uncharacterized protein n=1 Tax=Albugo candida TaxID=65357 RepID=A0A024FVP9_9STRA|nr:unnamed protein product [Albugo candida]|eukprot:CCI11101.1 unnamed protein product [Albugo candida]
MSLLSWMTRRKMKNGGAVTQSTDETSYDKHFSSQVRVLIEIRAAFGLYFACCCQCTFTLINLPVRFYYELRQVRPCSASLAYTLVKISIPSSCLVDPRVLVLGESIHLIVINLNHHIDHKENTSIMPSMISAFDCFDRYTAAKRDQVPIVDCVISAG